MRTGISSILVIGIGTELRGDDVAGLLAVRRLRTQGFPNTVGFLECSDDGVSLIDRWKDCDVALVIDAVSAGLAPGTIITADIRHDGLSIPVLQSSTHHIGLVETIRLARTLGMLPPVLLLHGIQGKTFRPGEDLSQEVAAAIDDVVSDVAGDLRQWCTARTGETHPAHEETVVLQIESNRGGTG